MRNGQTHSYHNMSREARMALILLGTNPHAHSGITQSWQPAFKVRPAGERGADGVSAARRAARHLASRAPAASAREGREEFANMA